MTQSITLELKKNDVPNGRMKEVTVSGKQIVIANTDGEFFAFDAQCTHAQCGLAGGYLDGYTVTCYCHGAQFDVSNGKVLAPPATAPLSVYAIKVHGDQLQIRI